MNPYTELARSAIKNYVVERKMLSVPDDLPREFYQKPTGVFVSLYLEGNLRGCIGTIQGARDSLADEIIHNAVAAATGDPRFQEISEAELSDLALEVSILSKPEKIRDLNQLDPLKYGIIVACSDGRCGLLLPDLPQVTSIEEQLTIASQKGGIDLRNDKNIEFYRFETKKF